MGVGVPLGSSYLQAQGCDVHHVQSSAVGTEQVPGFTLSADLEWDSAVWRGLLVTCTHWGPRLLVLCMGWEGSASGLLPAPGQPKPKPWEPHGAVQGWCTGFPLLGSPGVRKLSCKGRITWDWQQNGEPCPEQPVLASPAATIPGPG